MDPVLRPMTSFYALVAVFMFHVQALGQVGEVIKVAPDNAVHVYFPSIDLQFALHPGLVSAVSFLLFMSWHQNN